MNNDYNNYEIETEDGSWFDYAYWEYSNVPDEDGWTQKDCDEWARSKIS